MHLLQLRVKSVQRLRPLVLWLGAWQSLEKPGTQSKCFKLVVSLVDHHLRDKLVSFSYLLRLKNLVSIRFSLVESVDSSVHLLTYFLHFALPLFIVVFLELIILWIFFIDNRSESIKGFFLATSQTLTRSLARICAFTTLSISGALIIGIV